MNTLLAQIKEKVLNGQNLTFSEIKEVLSTSDLTDLLVVANDIRKSRVGNKVDLCSIINAKSGKCSEDCKFCAQSIYHSTGIEEYSLLDKKDILKRALENEEAGIHRFSLVTSGRGIIERDFVKILEIYKLLREKTNFKLCASHGLLNYEQLKKLKEVGVTNYHHNLEACEDFFPEICQTHSFADRVATIKNAQKVGLNVCCGGIIGLGESREDRIKLALNIRDLQINSIPINILTPIPGTPLENVKQLSQEEILRTLAMFRLVNSQSVIRFAGGRKILGEEDKKGFMGGVNGAIVGNYLTTIGPDVVRDIQMLKEIGLEVV